MIRTYCDVPGCGKEIVTPDGGRMIRVDPNGFIVEIKCRTSGKQACMDCQMKILAGGVPLVTFQKQQLADQQAKATAAIAARAAASTSAPSVQTVPVANAAVAAASLGIPVESLTGAQPKSAV